MEEANFSGLGKVIILVVQLAAEGQRPKAEELHEKVKIQVRSRLEEGQKGIRPNKQKIYRECKKRCANLFASVLRVGDVWRQAEMVLRELLQLAQMRLPAGAVDMLNSMTNLTTVLEKQGKLHEVAHALREAMQIACTHFGKDHQHTLRSMNNLANVLREQGKWQKAEEMHIEVLEGMRRVLGQDHQDTLSSMHNLATALQEQGKWQKAEEMHTEVLEARR
eukprot:s922_g3.t1